MIQTHAGGWYTSMSEQKHRLVDRPWSEGGFILLTDKVSEGFSCVAVVTVLQ